MRKEVFQHNLNDCGPACLATVLNAFGYNCSLIEVAEKMKTGKNGTSIAAIIETAEFFFLRGIAYESTLQEIYETQKRIRFPIIAHIIDKEKGVSHFIVLRKITKNKIFIFDPGKGDKKDNWEHFNNIWTGIIIVFDTMPGFIRRKKRLYSILMNYFELIKFQASGIITLIIMIIFTSALSFFVSVNYQQLVDKGIVVGNIERIRETGVHLIVASVVIFIVSNLQSILSAHISRNLQSKLMDKFYLKMLSLPTIQYEYQGYGGMIARFQELTYVREILIDGMISVIINLFMITTSIIILLNVNALLFFIVLIFMGIYLLVVLVYKSHIAEVNRDMLLKNNELISFLTSSITGMMAIKGFGIGNFFQKKFYDRKKQFLGSSYHQEVLVNQQSILIESIESIGIIVIVIVGGVLIVKQELSLGTLVLFLSVINYFTQPLKGLILLQPVIENARNSIDRINDVLLSTSEKTRYGGKSIPKSFEGTIQMKEVCFEYTTGDHTIWKLNMRINKNTHIAITGESGCGKSTIGKLIAQILVCDSGDILLDNVSVREFSLESIRENIIYIPQNSSIFKGTLLQNLCIDWNDLKNERVIDILEQCQIMDMISNDLEQLNMNVGDLGELLSGGQRQRIAIARALLHMPKIIIFDEALGQLDNNSERQIFNYIRKQCMHTTCIFITHNVDISQELDQVFWVEDGQIYVKGEV